MTLNKKELTQRLMNGEKLTFNNGDSYCFYDEEEMKNPFKIYWINIGITITMSESWLCTEWETYIEPFTPWTPEDLGNIYVLDTNGGIFELKYNNQWKKDLLQGNLFKTREEATYEAEWRKARYTLKQEIAKLNQEHWNPNWNNIYQNKYFCYYCFGVNKINVCVAASVKYHQDWFYLKTNELANQLIKTHSKELKIFLGVENEH